MVKQHMPWDGLSWGQVALEDSEEGKRTKKHDRKRDTGYPGSGLSEGDKTPTPALLCIDRLIDGTTMVFLELFG
jgi:hypothetical protein